MWGWLRRFNQAGGGLWLDLVLYGLSALFAWVTWAGSTLAPHRAWGGIAALAYVAGAMATLVQLLLKRAGAVGRVAVAIAVWLGAALLPLVIQAVQRSGGRTDRAQEEVLVIEDGGRRLLESGTPYLDRADIAALPADERLLGYLPYQPGMALFGLPRAASAGWWSDARVWFLPVTVAAVGAALALLWRSGVAQADLVRALQVVAVLPLCALTVATGGDDLPVLALCLLGLALAATRRWGWSGLAIGAAAGLKLFAWPVAVVVGAYAVGQGRPAWSRYLGGAIGLPILAVLPALLAGPGALVENVLAFPFGRGLVTSPAASPLPGHLIATGVPGGRVIAITLVLAAAVAVAVWLVRRPPRTATATSVVSGVALLTALLLLPATRFGYLLYPAALLVWAPALQPVAVRPPAVPAAADPVR